MGILKTWQGHLGMTRFPLSSNPIGAGSMQHGLACVPPGNAELECTAAGILIILAVEAC